MLICPRCGNDDPNKLVLVTEGGPFDRAAQENHEDPRHCAPKQQVRIVGSKCMRCGEVVAEHEIRPIKPKKKTGGRG